MYCHPAAFLENFGVGFRNIDWKWRSNLISQHYQATFSPEEWWKTSQISDGSGCSSRVLVGFYCRVLVGWPDNLNESDWFKFDSSRWASKTVKPSFKDISSGTLSPGHAVCDNLYLLQGHGGAAGFPGWLMSSESTSLGADMNHKDLDPENATSWRYFPFLRLPWECRVFLSYPEEHWLLHPLLLPS